MISDTQNGRSVSRGENLHLLGINIETIAQ